MKLGILIRDLSNTQLNYYIITRANRHLLQNPHDDIVVFYDEIVRPIINCDFPLIHSSECYGYCYPIIATDIYQAQKLLTCLSPTKKIFYINDIEWMRIDRKHFDDLAHVYLNKDLMLIARHEEHGRLVEKVWGRECRTVPNFDLSEIRRLIDAT